MTRAPFVATPLAIAFAVLTILPATAAAHGHEHGHAAASAPTAAATAEWSTGEVRKVDKPQGRLTIKHGELKNLSMPPMTMVFDVADRAVLDRVKAGDPIRFRAVDRAGKLTVTELAPAPR